MVKILALSLAIFTAVITLPPPQYPYMFNRQVFFSHRVDQAKDAEDAKKAEEAARQQPQPVPLQEVKVPPTVSLSGSLINMINQYRVSIGLSAEIESPDLDNSAAIEASHLPFNGFNHEAYSIIGWNSGYSDPDSKVVQDWIASPAHHAIIVEPHTYIGCGKVESDGRLWYSCQFN